MQSLSSGEDGHQVKCALMADNKLLNRFTNITVCESLSLSLSLPHMNVVIYIVSDDDNRVKLKAIAGRPDCHHDYINASYIDVSGLRGSGEI